MNSPAKATPSKVPFTVGRKLTIPPLKFEIDKPVYVLVTGPMHVGRKLKGSGQKSKMEPATLCNVVDMQTGEQFQLICATMIRGIFEDNYPNHSYVGNAFQIIKHNKREGKSYYDYSMDEVLLPDDKKALSDSLKAEIEKNPPPDLPPMTSRSGDGND
jgi:hypothetical protein